MIDYDLEQFTLSHVLVNEVTNAFIKLFELNLIFRDLRMIDYCCHLRTVISNVEVEVFEIDE